MEAKPRAEGERMGEWGGAAGKRGVGTVMGGQAGTAPDSRR